MSCLLLYFGVPVGFSLALKVSLSFPMQNDKDGNILSCGVHKRSAWKSLFSFHTRKTRPKHVWYLLTNSRNVFVVLTAAYTTVKCWLAATSMLEMRFNHKNTLDGSVRAQCIGYIAQPHLCSIFKPLKNAKLCLDMRGRLGQVDDFPRGCRACRAFCWQARFEANQQKTTHCGIEFFLFDLT